MPLRFRALQIFSRHPVDAHSALRRGSRILTPAKVKCPVRGAV